MILGILSDTHGRTAITMEAIRILRALDAAFFIHCGDLGDGVLSLLPRERSAFVFGNNDWDRACLIDDARRLAIQCLKDGGVLTLAGKSIAVTHGDVASTLNAFVTSGENDYVLSGHTHSPHDLRNGRTRRINPGALHRAAKKTVATLDLKTDLLTLHEIRDGD